MLLSTVKLQGYTLLAMDGEIGASKDLLFDDDRWIVRYLVASTGKWLPGRKVLISPIVIGEKPDWVRRQLPVLLTKQQIEDSPPLKADAPVSWEHQVSIFRYHGWPPYWHGGAAWGFGPVPQDLYRRRNATEVAPATESPDSDLPQLRSVREVTGYRVDALNGEIGHIEDFIVETTDWRLRYAVVDTRNWLPGKKVLVSINWLTDVSWTARQVSVDLAREMIENAPPFHPGTPVNRRYEERFYDYFGRPADW